MPTKSVASSGIRVTSTYAVPRRKITSITPAAGRPLTKVLTRPVRRSIRDTVPVDGCVT